ncbi:MAG: hypothetical protein ACRYE7_02540, partial [Janthinobacterium lividum]
PNPPQIRLLRAGLKLGFNGQQAPCPYLRTQRQRPQGQPAQLHRSRQALDHGQQFFDRQRLPRTR